MRYRVLFRKGGSEGYNKWTPTISGLQNKEEENETDEK